MAVYLLKRYINHDRFVQVNQMITGYKQGDNTFGIRSLTPLKPGMHLI
jgi:hypothetical protein